jgi:hypothetical protein
MDELVTDGRGWYKTYRQIEEWEWYKTPHMFHLFSHLLNRANFEDKKWQGKIIKRGEFVTSVQHLSDETGISNKSIRTCLSRLKFTGEISVKSANKYSIISIIKYDSYQSGDDETGKQRANKGQTKGNNEEVKKLRIKEKEYTDIPPSFEEVAFYCRERGKGVDPQRWFDFYLSKGWLIGKNQMKDWRAAVRTWESGANQKKENSEFI